MKKNDRLLSALTKIINVIYIGLVAVTILLVAMITISPFLSETEARLTASIPVSVVSGNEGRFDVEAGNKDVALAFVDEAQGILRLETTNWYFIFVSNMAKLVTAVGLAYIFYLLRAVLRAFDKGEIFSEENSQRLRRMGMAALVLAFIRPAVDYVAALEVLHRLTSLQPDLSLPSPFQVEALFASLMILIIAQVWSYGVELKTDRDLTI